MKLSSAQRRIMDELRYDRLFDEVTASVWGGHEFWELLKAGLVEEVSAIRITPAGRAALGGDDG